MTEIPRPPSLLQACLRLVRAVGQIVPAKWRAAWRQEWEAELQHRWQKLQEWNRATRRNQMKLFKRTLGAIADAAWLRQQFTLDLDVMQDIRYGLRMLRKNPGFTLVAVLTLALGIGANTAIFSVVNGVLLQPLPFNNPDQLGALWVAFDDGGGSFPQVSYLDYEDIRKDNEVFEDVAALWIQSWTLTGSGEAERVFGLKASPHLFSLLGVRPALGRSFLTEEGVEGKDNVVILSDRLWKSRFGGDRSLLGQTVLLNNLAHTVVGILPPGFDLEFPLSPSFVIKDVDMWAPLTPSHRHASNRHISTFEILARLKPGTTWEQAQANLTALGKNYAVANPDSNKGRSFRVVPLHEQVVGSLGMTLWTLLAAVGFVLLIACANVANLLLSRVSARQREVALRAALGASRGRILRQLLTESVLLSLLGGAGGLLLAQAGLQALLSLAPESTPRLAGVVIDWRIFLFGGGLSLMVGLAAGLWPALALLRTDLQPNLREGSPRVAGGGSAVASNSLIIAEVALGVVLLTGAGLFIGSLQSLMDLDPGFQTANRLVFSARVPSAKYPDFQQCVNFFHELRQRISVLPGVEAITAVSHLPLSGSNSGSSIRIEGRPLPPDSDFTGVGWQVAQPGYFSTIGIPLLSGRDFTEDDRTNDRHVTILNELAARTFFPGEDPLGKRVSFGPPRDNPDWHEIIGVVGTIRHRKLESSPWPRAYDLYGQHGGNGMAIVVQTSGDPNVIAPSVRRQLRELDPDIPMVGLATLENLRLDSASDKRFLAVLTGSFAAIALLLAAVGIYGVISSGVSQRTREFGIRMALGAQRRKILNLVIRRGLMLTLAGLALGLAGSFGLTRYVESLLFGVSTTDPFTFTAVSLLLTGVALLACYVPARRATKVDPMVALRYE